MKALIIFAKVAIAATVLAASADAQTVFQPVNEPMIDYSTIDNPGAVCVEHIGTIIPIATIAPVTIAPAANTQPKANALPSANAQPIAYLELMADSISPEASRIATVEGMTRVIAQLVRDRTPGSTQRLRAGKAMDITTMIDTDRSVAAWHSVNVKASYDARPIGGILDIRVGLAPVFGGIGAAVRSVNYREFDEAIDSFDDDFVAQTISRLTEELAAEYTKDH